LGGDGIAYDAWQHFTHPQEDELIMLKRIALSFALLLGAAATAAAQATQQVTFTVADVKTVAVSGNPASMMVNAGGAGSTVMDSSTTYDVTTNATSALPAKITAQITTGGDMPTGVTLSTNLADPDGASTGAASAGDVALVSTAAKDVVTSLSNIQATGNMITYTLTADVSAAAVSGATRIVTYTIQ
jgi:hypothetical protein